jgi:hypothetical protein
VRTASGALAVALAVVLAFVLVGVPAGPAGAADPPPFASSAATRYQVTLAARSCENYAALTANQVRGDPTETLVRAGRDSADKPGQPVSPDSEQVASDGCRPLVGWRFTFGSGQERKGALSVVTGATVPTQPTVAETPRLDAVGRPTGQSVSGAITGTLTDEQVRLAVRRQLWVQGGTPDDPLLAKAYKGYSFGALRCGIDGHTNGNTQWVGFPPGARHVFCFAYYVHTAPYPGTVTVRVRPTRPVGYAQPFTFQSDLTRAPSGQFAVSSAGEPADATYVRAGGATYAVQPQLPPGWRLVELTCAAARPGGGKATSTSTTDPATGRASVALVTGETVTCTYSVDPPPLGPGLTVRVLSENGSGTFGVTVDGPGGVRTLTAAPAGDGNAVAATGADLTTITEGQYTLRATPPSGSHADAWALSAVTCGGKAVPADNGAATVAYLAGSTLECVLRLTHPPASLKLRVVTAGGVATAGFAVVPADQPAVGWAAAGTTTGYGVPAGATGDLPAQLPFGTYLLTAVPPASTVDGGWQLTGLACTGGQPATADGAVMRLTLDPKAADAVCTASYQLVASTRLQVVARADGAVNGRTAALVVEIACGDGSGGRVVLAAQNTLQESLPDELSFMEPTTCTITQSSGGGTTASVLVEPAHGNGTLSLPVQVDVARDVPEYTVTVTDHFTGAGSDTRGATLIRSFKVLPVALIGVGMITLGALVLAGLVLRRRSAYNPHRVR